MKDCVSSDQFAIIHRDPTIAVAAIHDANARRGITLQAWRMTSHVKRREIAASGPQQGRKMHGSCETIYLHNKNYLSYTAKIKLLTTPVMLEFSAAANS